MKQPNVTLRTAANRLPRHDEITIHWLRIEHTFLTHGHLLERDSSPQFSVCQTRLTVEHVLRHCPTWNATHVNILLSQASWTCSTKSPAMHHWFYQRNWIWSPNVINKFYVHRFYVCTIFIYCAYSAPSYWILPRTFSILTQSLSEKESFVHLGHPPNSPQIWDFSPLPAQWKDATEAVWPCYYRGQ